jgi:hypothetical protein
MDTRKLNYDQAMGQFWQLYGNCCGEVTNPGDKRKLTDRDGNKVSPDVSSVDILMAGMLKLDCFNGREGNGNGNDAGILLSGVPRVMKEIVDGKMTPRMRGR